MSSVETGPAAAQRSDREESHVLDTRVAGPAALRGSLLRAGSYVLGILLSLVSVRVLIDHLGVSDFGRYVTVVSLVTVVGGFTEGGLNTVVLRGFATLEPVDRRAMMRSAIGIRLVVTSLGVGLAVGFAALAGYDGTLVLGTVLAGVALVIQLLQSTLATTLQAELRFGWVSLGELLRQLVNVALLVALALAGAGLLPLLAVAIPASAASLAFTVPLIVRSVSLRPSIHPRRWWSLLSETVPWAVISAVNVVYFRVSIVIMSMVAPAAQTGYFATSFRVVEVLIGVPGLLIGAAFPILARAERDDRDRFTSASRRIIELAILAGTWVVMCLEVGAGFAVHVIAGAKADPSIAVLRIQGLALIATFVAFACGFPLLTMRRYRAALLINLGALVLSAALTSILAPPDGARGAAVAAVIAESSLAVGCAVALATGEGRVRFPLVCVPVGAIAAVAGVAVGLALPIHPVLGVAIASLVYCGVLHLLGRFPPEVAEILTGLRASGRLRRSSRARQG